eukprot:CAMPEP_0206139630 /NCGR_PEP_ID=MMETSP1473-20131121/6791_1 /ASSEMBLY_ACC=CAM_ASM_001109 /TAXON_ID=1461547 /ORGANISM="Stichococcus sp, Strain RCC1054" /LENGTH=144 /DNA_ID=CAMNT_0053533499 /DNA_START=439 /DNA_END=871 /DNA_ORIENTATION=+
MAGLSMGTAGLGSLGRSHRLVCDGHRLDRRAMIGFAAFDAVAAPDGFVLSVGGSEGRQAGHVENIMDAPMVRQIQKVGNGADDGSTWEGAIKRLVNLRGPKPDGMSLVHNSTCSPTLKVPLPPPQQRPDCDNQLHGNTASTPEP